MNTHTSRAGYAVLSALVLALLAGCGAYHPGTPGHEPPAAGRYNPASGETNSGPR